jgi:8-oxo-dGTP diphosphatase
MKTIDVVAAVIVDASNRVLIARRHQHKTLAGKWEFPGGKVEEGETYEQALQRELFEEFAIQTTTKEFIGANIHQYEHIAINLRAYISEYHAGEFSLSDHDTIAWVLARDLRNYDFADADIPFISAIEVMLNNK